MLKITKVINRRVGDTEYHRYRLTLPNDIVKKLRWSEKTNVTFKIKDGKLVIEKK